MDMATIGLCIVSTLQTPLINMFSAHSLILSRRPSILLYALLGDFISTRLPNFQGPNWLLFPIFGMHITSKLFQTGYILNRALLTDLN